MDGVDEAEMRRRVEAARVARLATIRPDGRPHVIPVVFALEGDVLLTSVDGKPKSTLRLRRLENIAANPDVEVVVDHYEDEWDALWWIRLSGRARVVPEGPERERGIALLEAKYPQYERWGPLGEVIVVDVDAWHGWSMGVGEGGPV